MLGQQLSAEVRKRGVTVVLETPENYDGLEVKFKYEIHPYLGILSSGEVIDSTAVEIQEGED